MRIFLSYSSHDSHIVTEVWERLGPQITWLDRVNIDLGDIILEKIARGIEEATDFVLFWSKSASQSQWVRIELHMGFLRSLEQSGCKLRVVTLDKTPLPLYLKPFLHLDVSDSLEEATRVITEKLLAERTRLRGSVRKLFVNRHDELQRLELAIDHADIHVILVQGLSGIGKRSLTSKAVESFFSPPDIRAITVRPGTGWVELALQLSAIAEISAPQEGAPQEDIESNVRTAIEQILNKGALLAFYEVQHWIEEDGQTSPIFTRLLEWFNSIPAMSSRPVLLTSTRIPRFMFKQKEKCEVVRIEGIPSQHLSALIRHWLRVEKGEAKIDEAKLNTLTLELYGYPLAGRIAASLIAQYGIDQLLAYPREIIELRVDITKNLLTEAKVTTAGVQILQALALLDAPMPSSYIASALGLAPEEFREGVESALSFGLLNMDGLALALHPLVRDFYWRVVYLSPAYHDIVATLAEESRKYLNTLELGSEEYAKLLPTVFRLIALTGDVDGARQLRRDLVGTLLETAIQLYNRRENETALKYIQIILDEWPNDWQARLYHARCLTRLAKLKDAKEILQQMYNEQPWSVPVLHSLGRVEMEEEQLEKALTWFSKALQEWSMHLPSLRDSAECFFRLGDITNTERFVGKAKEIDSANPYVLQIESRVLEQKGCLNEAYEVMVRAKAREPQTASFAHRLGRIAELRGDRAMALDHYKDALQLDERFLEARLSEASVLVDLRELELASKKIDSLRGHVHGSAAAVLRGIEAKFYLVKGDLDTAMQTIKRDKSAVSFGLRARIEMAKAKIHRQSGYIKLAEQQMAAAKAEVAEGLERYPDSQELLKLKRKLQGKAEKDEDAA